MTKIKICGLTREEDAARALALGADMLGFIHVEASPRYLDPDRLKTLLATVKNPAVRRVVVVRNLDAEGLAHLRKTLDFEDFQFHGDEPPDLVSAFGGYKVCHVAESGIEPNNWRAYGRPIMLDSQKNGRRGGTGETWDWPLLASVEGNAIVAGGLNPENVGALVARYRPWAVDVSSGIESAAGQKDHALMARFISKVRSAAKP